MIVTGVDPDTRPHEDALLVAHYCRLLEEEAASGLYSQLLVNLSCMNQIHRQKLIDLANEVQFFEL